MLSVLEYCHFSNHSPESSPNFTFHDRFYASYSFSCSDNAYLYYFVFIFSPLFHRILVLCNSIYYQFAGFRMFILLLMIMTFSRYLLFFISRIFSILFKALVQFDIKVDAYLNFKNLRKNLFAKFIPIVNEIF